MDLKLKNKVALITGASRGLGFATAQELLKEGSNVIICARNEESLRKAVSQLKSEAHNQNSVLGFVADVGNENQVQSLINNTLSHFGQLDILITNSGGPPAGIFTTHNMLTWHQAINQTFMGTIQLIHYALPHLLEGTAPSILTVTSLAAKQPFPELIIGNSLRSALMGLTKTLSIELGPQGVRVNSILPGWIKTQRSQELLIHMAHKSQRNLEEEYADKESKIPLRRIGEPEEFAKLAAFLVSPAASYITGAMLQVDGGMYSGF